MLQTLIVSAIVAAAAVYLLRFAWQMYVGRRSTCGCGETECAKKAVPRS